MNERIPPGMIRIGCTCCQLPQVIKDRDGAVPKVCDTCYPHHRGERIETRAARAESHEAMLRERLTACRASEERAGEELTAAREQVHAALESRGRLAGMLVDAANEDRKHNCMAQSLGRDSEIIEYARRHRLHQDRYWGRD